MLNIATFIKAMRYNYTLAKMATMSKTDNTKF